MPEMRFMAGIGRKWPFIDMAHDTSERDKTNLFIV